MKYWCKKHRKYVTNDEAEGRCLLENSNKGCVNLTKKRGDAKTSGPKSFRKPEKKGETPTTEKMPDITEFSLYHSGHLPINSKTGEGTVLQRIIAEQWKLFECLQSAKVKVSLILRNGQIIEGWLWKLIEEGYYKIRVKVGPSSDGSGYGGIFIDTWPRQVIAVKFELATDLKSLEFPPYLNQAGYYDTWRTDLSKIEGDLFWDAYDLLKYFRYGKNCIDPVELSLVNGMKFTGSLEYAGSGRILLSLGSSEGIQTYLDIHPLTAIASVRYDCGAKGWPHAPE